MADLIEMWKRFGGGPKDEAEARRRREIQAQLGPVAPDAWPTADELRALLAEIDATRPPPRVAARALTMAIGKAGDYDPAAVWLTLRARERMPSAEAAATPQTKGFDPAAIWATLRAAA